MTEIFLFPLEGEINYWRTLAFILDLGIHYADHPEGQAATDREALLWGDPKLQSSKLHPVNEMTRRHFKFCDSLPLRHRQSFQLFCLLPASTIREL